MNPILDAGAAFGLRLYGLSLALGAGLGLVFVALRVLRALIRFSAVAVAVQDLLFWLTAAPAVFLLCYAENDGIVRGFVLAGVGLGGLLVGLLAGDPAAAAARRLRALLAPKRCADGADGALGKARRPAKDGKNEKKPEESRRKAKKRL